MDKDGLAGPLEMTASLSTTQQTHQNTAVALKQHIQPFHIQPFHIQKRKK